MRVFTAHVVTESSDHYVWVYAKKPTINQVIKHLWESERAESLEWYQQTTDVEIKETEIIGE